MENKQKKERLYTAIDKIKARFGEDKIAHLGESRVLKKINASLDGSETRH